jgi:uroporphyrinogen III methyltransferase/synthase
MSTPPRSKRPTGRVAVVGAGPGDPGLLSVRAVELIGSAELVVADARVPDEVLAHVAEGADVVRSAPGESVAAQLVAAAKEGRDAISLVPGDPFFLAEPVKDVEALLKAKLRVEVIPGVPTAVGVTAYAGVPLGLPRTVVAADEVTDWRPLAQGAGSLVVLTRAGDVGKAARALIEHGRRGDTAVAVTVHGTTAEQHTVVSTLDQVDRDLVGVGGDAVVVVGDAVKKAAKLGWWESRALYGWRVLVPRTRDQAGALSVQLRAHGAIPVEVPTIAVEPPRTPAPMERAVKGLVDGRYRWVAFTSTNAVKAVREKLEEFGLDARAFSGVRIAAVGDATAQALLEFGIRPDLVPSGQQSSDGLLADWEPFDEVFDQVNRVLLPRADIATETLLAGLQELGWEVDDVTAYRTVRAAPPAAEIREALKGGGFDAVLFTSSSTVRNLVGIAGKPHDSTVLAAIGPQTDKTAVELGLRVDVLSPRPDVASLVDALAEHALERRAAGHDLPSAARRRRLARQAARANLT